MKSTATKLAKVQPAKLGDLLIATPHQPASSPQLTYWIVQTHSEMYMAILMETSRPFPGIYETPEEVYQAIRLQHGAVYLLPDALFHHRPGTLE